MSNGPRFFNRQIVRKRKVFKENLWIKRNLEDILASKLKINGQDKSYCLGIHIWTIKLF